MTKGRLDLRVMILGCMRNVPRGGVPEVDPDLLSVTQHPKALVRGNSLPAAVRRTGGITSKEVIEDPQIVKNNLRKYQHLLHHLVSVKYQLIFLNPKHPLR